MSGRGLVRPGGVCLGICIPATSSYAGAEPVLLDWARARLGSSVEDVSAWARGSAAATCGAMALIATPYPS
jgi:hypothetical protein